MLMRLWLMVLFFPFSLFWLGQLFDSPSPSSTMRAYDGYRRGWSYYP